MSPGATSDASTLARPSRAAVSMSAGKDASVDVVDLGFIRLQDPPAPRLVLRRQQLVLDAEAVARHDHPPDLLVAADTGVGQCELGGDRVLVGRLPRRR